MKGRKQHTPDHDHATRLAEAFRQNTNNAIENHATQNAHTQDTQNHVYQQIDEPTNTHV